MNARRAMGGEILCDGCGQGTTSEHIARRLKRLELSTRFRPIHIQTVFLSRQSPADENSFLYGAQGRFTGEGAALLSALQIEHVGRDVEAVLAEFQRRGFFLTHLLECAPEGCSAAPNEAISRRLPAVIRKLRGSLKPKRVVVISKQLAQVVGELRAAQIGAELVSDGDQPFDLEHNASVSKLTSALKGL